MQSLSKAIQERDDLIGKVDYYNRYFAERRVEFPLEVLDLSEDALRCGHRIAYSQGVFQTLIHRAYSYIQISEMNQAEEEIGKLKQLFSEEAAWDRSNMYFYHLLCLYYCGKTYHGLCYDYAYRCLALARKLSEHRISASVLDVLGQMNGKMKIYDKALSFFDEARESLAAEEDIYLSSIISCHRGAIFALMGNVSRARCSFHDGYRLIKKESVGSRGYAWVLKKFAAFEEGAGNLATAEYLYEEALNTLESTGYNDLAAEFRLNLGRLLLKRGEEKGVRLLLDQRTSLLGKGRYGDVLSIGDLIAQHYMEKGDYRVAADELKLLRDISKKMQQIREKEDHNSCERDLWAVSREYMKRVSELGSRLVACRNREDIFRVLTEALGFLKDEDGLFVVEEKSDSQLELIYGRMCGVTVKPRQYGYDPETDLAAYCLRKDQSLLIDDFNEEKGFFLSRKVMGIMFDEDFPPSRSLLNIVFRREETRCVISLQCRERKAFRFHQLEFLKSLLPFVSVALDNEQKTGVILKLSSLDSLTELCNRREFMRLLHNSWSAHGRSGDPLSLLMIDIDYFKSINDAYGHKAGDEGLKSLSRLLESHFKRTTDVCCRYGGEEFIILSGYTDEETCQLKAEKMRRDVEEHIFQVEEHKLSFTVSIGTVTVIPSEEVNVEKIISEADLSLYEAKNNGRNCVVSCKGISLSA